MTKKEEPVSEPVAPMHDPEYVAKLEAQLKAQEAELDTLQKQAKELLERVGSEQDARADEPSGISVTRDTNFLKFDPLDHKMYMGDKGKEVRKDRAYRWVNTDHRWYDNRKFEGWVPVDTAKGQIRHGDLLLHERPLEMREAALKQSAERQRLMEASAMSTFDRDAAKAGVETFEGNKSLEEGLR